MTILVQHEWIERVRALAQADERLVAALTYGSFTKGEGDQYSDVEFWLFVRDDAFAHLDRVGWIEAVTPTLAVFDDLPAHLTLAIFEGYRRGEFHFARASEMSDVRSWVGNGPFPAPEAMLLVDRTGELHGHLRYLHDHPPKHGEASEVLSLAHSFINWYVQGAQVLRRGEHARALDALGIVHIHLLQLARLVEGTTRHWPTPSKNAEVELSAEAYARFRQCTSALEPRALKRAYAQSWGWGKELVGTLLSLKGVEWPAVFEVAFETLFAAEADRTPEDRASANACRCR
ncbi:lincosamide nucleotidyltransferase Lnu(F) [Deinococcus yavapaiensis]|uniref:Lincosamide nucleotidyltransferase n=1 Tax=Deinococcus yavapaiensis KR-236 TaxID=694435 RepID=A0A318SEU5_9DEIO|nr:lincosamide nucleotidyltransferase Lnu(F) [Deinococcus yavapaiensis]PYE56307.1 lincosamide nucleotidyltransferase [Deinococcus yavapaiensis KR-236]